MSTAATILFVTKDKDGNEHPWVKIYHHGDGYIDGVGHMLAMWLKDRNLCNGISRDCDDTYANGVGCLIAQFIRDFKHDIGGLYIEPIDCSDEWFDYNYKVEIKDDVGKVNKLTTISVTNFGSDKVVWKGSPKQLLKTSDREVYKYDDE